MVMMVDADVACLPALPIEIATEFEITLTGTFLECNLVPYGRRTNNNNKHRNHLLSTTKRRNLARTEKGLKNLKEGNLSRILFRERWEIN